MGSSTKHIQYRFDAAGNRTLMIDPDGGRFTYAYNNMNRISHLVNSQEDRTTYSYDANGRRTLTRLANGTRASFTYDAASRLTRLANLKSDGTTISSFDYQYDKAGNRTSVLEADGSRVTYSYDKTYQLTSEHRAGTTPYRNTFTYDPAGNRTLKNEAGARTTYAYDAANQLNYAQDGTGRTTYTFDADGNQQLVVSPTGDRTTTTWDYENKTTLVKLPSGVRNTMAYDTEGLRVKLEESTGTKKFVWDDQNYLAETDENNDTQMVYTNEPQVYGNLISQRRSITTSWYHYDALGSTQSLTNASAVQQNTYLYTPFGELTSSTGTVVNPFTWIGEIGYYLDETSGLYILRRRPYLATIARFITTDPLGLLSDVLNLYLYGRNSPLSYVDPSGLGCKVTYRCQLNIAQDDESCTYSCLETDDPGPQNYKGTDAFFNCDDFKKRRGQGKKHKIYYQIRRGCGDCPSPNDVMPTLDYNTIGTDCSLSKCKDACERGGAVKEVCGLIKDKVLRKICEVGVGQSEEFCKDMCRIMCNKK